MPAPLDIMTAYARAKKDARKASAMAEMGIDHTIQFWATATDSAKNIVNGFLCPTDTSAQTA